MKLKFVEHLDIRILNIIHIQAHREMNNSVHSLGLENNQTDISDNDPVQKQCDQVDEALNITLSSREAFQIKHKYAKPLEYISYIGVGLSMADVVITILFQKFTRKTRKSSVMWMLVSLCSCMLIFNIIFITEIENRNARNHSDSTTSHYQQYLPYDTISNTLLTSDLVDPPTDSWCTAVAVLLHYFLLATFMWSALSSAQLYFLLLTAMKPLPEHFLITMSVIGWGIPAVVVAITLGDTYREGKALNCRKAGRIVSSCVITTLTISQLL
ncbi:adhesion G-protein coupled receptor G7 [Lathamus discolor]|uniref:adhesion G-protein coupled receptor G7 n=1 Tax=Lathamus discolor TaxID=678569 RepID=UPI0032B75578